MRYTFFNRVLPVLGLAALMAGCTAPNTTLPTPIIGTTSSATVLPSLTPVPVVTVTPTPAPLIESTATVTLSPPTALPTATSAPAQSLLPRDAAWIGLPDALVAANANKETFRLADHSLPSPSYFWSAARDGSYVAYRDQNGTLVIVNMTSGDSFTLPENGQTVAGFAFSPDHRFLAYTEIDQSGWSLKIRELASWATRTLQTGELFPQQGSPAGVLSPTVWDDYGLLAQRLLWGSDAIPFSLSLIDPQQGEIQVLREESALGVYPSPDGTKIALVTGRYGMGGPGEQALVLLDPQGGEQIIVPTQISTIRSVRWSPDGNQLIYHTAPDAPATSLVMINADGSDERRIELGAGVEGGGHNMQFMDVTWSHQDGILLLLSDETRQVRLFALPDAAFDHNWSPDTIREVGAYGVLPEDLAWLPIVYTP